ncbi:hypothetical protein NQ318_018288 [Aromia moschata]|uniref:DALR anticodon binding domain-containing protein n=1 Tax=Aromia moschata TaxID=1265417 RepID=A0AAV8ZF57_9CUCU|nr:hypothetical protein NQ318_018288 [Aromia moschata]
MYGSSEVIHKDITLNMDFDVNAHQTAEIDLSTLRLLILKDVTSNLLTFTAKSTNEGSCNIVFTMNSLTSCHPCILCGPVLNSDGMKDNNTKAGELLTKRAADMRMMAQHKYGVQIKPNASWKIYFEKLGRAAVTIEMLSNKPLKALKLNMHDLQTANKAVLFKELHKRISEGIYPSLPDIEDVDFSVLNQPEEWELFYVYILQFPITIKHCIRDIEKGTVNPQYLISFLSSLSSVFSAYYRRVRILTDPREHLFGILHARVYLLEAVQCVFHNALFLLNIEPIKEM